MKTKKTIGLIITLLMGILTASSVIAGESVPTVQYDLQTFGNATVISLDDYLLDGNYENGELVNGSIYHSESEAVAGVKKDKIEARNLHKKYDENLCAKRGKGIY